MKRANAGWDENNNKSVQGAVNRERPKEHSANLPGMITT